LFWKSQVCEALRLKKLIWILLRICPGLPR
jgi:hypothetical protein